MHLSQDIHKLIAVSLVKQALQQREIVRKTDAWHTAVCYAQENIQCPQFLHWVSTHADKTSHTNMF